MDGMQQELGKSKQRSERPDVEGRLKESENSLTRFQDFTWLSSSLEIYFENISFCPGIFTFVRKRFSDARIAWKFIIQLQNRITHYLCLRCSSKVFRLDAVYNIPTPPPRKRIGNEITDGVLQMSLVEENKKLKKDVEM